MWVPHQEGRCQVSYYRRKPKQPLKKHGRTNPNTLPPHPHPRSGTLGPRPCAGGRSPRNAAATCPQRRAAAPSGRAPGPDGARGGAGASGARLGRRLAGGSQLCRGGEGAGATAGRTAGNTRGVRQTSPRRARGAPRGGAARPARYLQARSADMPPARGPPEGERPPQLPLSSTGGGRRELGTLLRGEAAAPSGRGERGAAPPQPRPARPPAGRWWRRWRGWPPGGCERRSPRPPGGGAPRRRSRTHRRGAGGGSAAPPPRHWPAAALPVAAAAASSSSCSAEARPGRAGPSGALGLLLPSARRGICGPSFRGTRGPGLPPEATPATSSKSQTPSAVGFFYPRF